MPMLETVPPGGREWLNRGCAAKRRLIASSALNSIRSRFVSLKIEEATIITMRKAKTRNM